MNRDGVPKDADLCSKSARVMREEVEDAVRKLVTWAGDDPDREGLVDTPRRVVKAYEEFFSREELLISLNNTARRIYKPLAVRVVSSPSNQLPNCIFDFFSHHTCTFAA